MRGILEHLNLFNLYLLLYVIKEWHDRNLSKMSKTALLVSVKQKI